MKVVARNKINPTPMEPDDSITLYLDKTAIYSDGTEVLVSHKEVLTKKINRCLTVDEAVIFDVEPGDFEGASDGIGGAFLSSKKEEK